MADRSNKSPATTEETNGPDLTLTDEAMPMDTIMDNPLMTSEEVEADVLAAQPSDNPAPLEHDSKENSTILPPTDDVQVQEKEIISFIDTNAGQSGSAVVKGSAIVGRREIRRSTILDERVHTIHDWTKRPLVIARGLWNLTTPALIDNLQFTPTLPQSPILAIRLPHDIIYGGVDASTTVIDKLKGFSAFTCDYRLKFQFNAQQFQWGIAKIVAIPFPDTLNGIRGAITQNILGSSTSISQLRGVEVRLPSSPTAEFFLPWIGPFPYFDINMIGKDMWKVYVYAYTKLGDVGGPGAVEVSVFGNLENTKFVLPTGVQPPGPARRERYKKPSEKLYRFATAHVNEAKEDQESGTLSGIAGSISNIAAKGAMLPVVGEFAAPIAAGAAVAANLAKSFGMSKPIGIGTPQISRLTPFGNLGNVDGEFTGKKTSASVFASLEPVVGWGGSKLDEMSIIPIVTRFCLLDSFLWDEANAADVTLWNVPISPFYVKQPTFDSGTTSYQEVPTPMAFVGLMHSFWRGSIAYRFKIAKNKFYSGRLRVLYEPLGNVAGNTSQRRSKIFDITDETEEFVITVPYWHTAQYRTSPATIFDNNNKEVSQFADTIMGYLYVEVLNPLRVTSTVPKAIPIIVEVAACNDFEVANPIKPDIAIYYATNNFRKTAKAHVGEVLTETALRENRIPTFSGSMTKRSTTAAMTTQGEVNFSLRPLLKIPSLIWTTPISLGKSGDNQALARIAPWGHVGSTVSDGQTPADYYDLIGMLFRFMRGGIRLTLISADHASWGQVTTGYSIQKNLTIPSLVTGYLGVYPHVFVSTRVQHHFIQTEGGVEIEIPYSAPYHCVLNTYPKPTESIYDEISRDNAQTPFPSIDLASPNTNTTDLYYILRSGADDLDFAYFLCTSAISYTSVKPTKFKEKTYTIPSSVPKSVSSTRIEQDLQSIEIISDDDSVTPENDDCFSISSYAEASNPTTV